MTLRYNVIEIFTSEGARYHGKPVSEAILRHVRAQKVAARCIVTRGISGCYENGEIATHKILILTYNMPIKIEVILPAAELEHVLPGIEEIVTDGIVVVEEMEIRSHRTSKRLVPRHLLVRDAMTSTPAAVRPGTPISDAVRILLSADHNALPVVDSGQRPVGIVTQGDLIQRANMPVRLGLLHAFGAHRVDTWLEAVSEKTVEDVMTHPAVVIRADQPLTEAVDVMLHRKLKRLPVVDEIGRLDGVIARYDVFRTITTESPDWERLSSHNVQLSDVRFVRDVMRGDTHTAQPDTPVEEILRTIDANDIQRVAVVDSEGRLLGLISDRDIFSAFSDHHGSLWDYLLSKVTFGETAQLHKEFFEHARARTAADVMKRDLVMVHEGTSLEEAVRLMVEHQLKRLPVVDPQGHFSGMVSRDSILRAGQVAE